MTSVLKLPVVAAVATLLLAGCGSYYQVRDASSSKEYYTTDIDRAGSAIKFKDLRTGSTVTLQNSEVKEISKDEFAKATAKTAPAAAPATTPAAPPAK